MATYAAFKHVELYNVGKAKKRVLRAPGGASSDIFGSDMPQTPRNVKNLMPSNIFSVEKDAAQKTGNNGDAPRRGQKPVDSYSRLFGEPARPITPGKNHMKSSIAFGQNTNGAQLTSINKGNYNGKSGSVSSTSSSVSSSTENLKINGAIREGNPVTGEGYKAGGTDYIQPAPLNGGQVVNKNRVPPGGYSSGLW